jgi:glycosyltransferase involved in cell wall biosynthesis
VSAIVTTCGRPHLVVNAVRSVLGQTLGDCEVVVVVDGPDAATEDALRAIDDARVRVHVRATRGGQGAAINSGIALARGEWTALLDDDDEWLPQKLERQLRAAETCVASNPVVACRFLARSENHDAVWPRRSPDNCEPVCEYLFCRRSLAFGDGIIPTSTIFARTALFKAVPLDERLRRHCDLDWLTRADQRADVMLHMTPGDRPLAIWHMQQDRSRMSNDHDWRDSYAWLESVRDRMSARAYAGCLLTWVSFSARRERELGAFTFLLRKAFARGRPSALELAVHAAIWAIPDSLRERLSRAMAFGSSA